MSATYTVTLTAEELEIVTTALGRRPVARKVAERRASTKPRTFGAPRLNASQQARAVDDWKRAVENGGEWWRSSLASIAAHELGYGTSDAVRRAWGEIPHVVK